MKRTVFEPKNNLDKWEDPKFWENLKDENGTATKSIRWLMIFFGFGVASVIQDKLKQYNIKPKLCSTSTIGKTYSEVMNSKPSILQSVIKDKINGGVK